MGDTNRVTREGIAAGLIGATAVAVWFAILDLIQGKFLATPVMLGTSLGSLFLNGDTPGQAAAFLGYTLFHYSAFVAAGLGFSWVVNGAEKVPSVVIGLLGLLAVFEVWWVGGTYLLSRGFGELTWAQVFIANLIGAGVMSFYLWRQHPLLATRVDAVLAGARE
ncbi:MAG: hypothetical protein ABI852_03255 [Gemmatimonadaceae bacterium]